MKRTAHGATFESAQRTAHSAQCTVQGARGRTYDAQGARRKGSRRRITLRVARCAWVVVMGGGLLASCQNAGEDRVLAVNATGVVSGVAYFDANGNLIPETTPDVPLSGVRVALIVPGGVDTVAEASSGADGTFEMLGVPVGQYTLVVDTSTIGDTVEVVRIDTSVVELVPDDLVNVDVTISYPALTTAEVRALAPGRKAFIGAVALSSITTGQAGPFGDTTVHIVDVAGALRATNVRRSTVILGDSMRFLGTRRVRDGQPVLDQVEAFFVAIATIPQLELVTTAAADTADGGRIDAALVRVDSATISDTTSVTGGLLVTLDDGSGPLEVLIAAGTGIDTSPYEATVVVDAIGVLVPTGTGRWRLKPRAAADLVIR